MKVKFDVKFWRSNSVLQILTLVLMFVVYNSLVFLPKSFDRLYAAQTDFNPAQPCIRANGFAPEVVALEGGTFLMGSPDNESERLTDERLHEVTVESFAISRCEITFADYQRYIDDAAIEEVTPPSDNRWGRAGRPVINVNWRQASAYAAWLTDETGEDYRLPTEAQWEYAARAMDSTTQRLTFNTGSCITPEQANYDDLIKNAYADCVATDEFGWRTQEVGSYQPNQWGLFDMHGNVWEWTCSSYDSDYGGSETVCDENEEKVRVMRGGSWISTPQRLRSAFRGGGLSTDRSDTVGFRVVRVLR